MRCFKKVLVNGNIVACPNPLQCGAVRALKEKGRVAVLRPDGFVAFYEAVDRGDVVCLRKIGLGNEYMIGKGDVVVVLTWVDADYWRELQSRGVAALVKPLPKEGLSKEP